MWPSIALAVYVVGANALPWLLVRHMAWKFEREAVSRNTPSSLR